MTPSDRLYDLLVQHHRTCPSCTDAQDCARAHALLMAWGAAESHEDQWWREDLERDAVRDVSRYPEELAP